MPNQQPDTTSFLSRHRTICEVLEEARELAVRGNNENEPGYYSKIHTLLAEAKDYAQRMSARLMEYKRAEQKSS